MNDDRAIIIVQLRSGLIAAGEVRKGIGRLKSSNRFRRALAIGPMASDTCSLVNVLAGVELQGTTSPKSTPAVTDTISATSDAGTRPVLFTSINVCSD